MSVQAIGATGAGMNLASVKPHSDGLEPPRMQASNAVASNAQSKAAVSGVEASEPRQGSHTRLDVYA